MLLPPTCPVCGAAGAAPCTGCAALLRPAPALATPAGLDACLALLAYEGAGRELVARLKYRGNRAALGGLATALAALLLEHGPLPAGAAVAWAPTTPARRRQRGFDHAELLARAVGRRAGLPVAGLLRRAPGPPQTGRPAAARAGGPTFGARRRPPRTVVLVDDVATTGATLTAAAAALRAAGAAAVVGLVAARTPPPTVSPARRA